jgi:hypothetical protein
LVHYVLKAKTFQLRKEDFERLDGVDEALNVSAVMAGHEQVVDENRSVEVERVVSHQNDFVVFRRLQRR